MPKVSYILFGLMVVGLTASIILYNGSKVKTLRFSERTETVKEVLFLLERTEKLKNILRKTVFDAAHQTDTAFVFSATEKSEIDSILNRLHHIVLYEDQRSRVDTIKRMIDHNFDLVVNETKDVRNFQAVSPIIGRAQAYAQRRLAQHEAAFIQNQKNVDLWTKIILGLSSGLFVIGIWTAIGETRARKKLKNLHENILENASIGICVFEFSKQADGTASSALIFSNYGAVATGARETVVNLSGLASHRDIQESIRLVLATGKTIVKEIKQKEGADEFWFITSLSKVSAHHVAFYYQDISRIKSFESSLQQKLRELEMVNTDLEQFAHATSHDLREPFRKIQVMADLIKNNHNVNGHPKYIEAIIRASDKGSLLVEQILNYSKVQFDRTELEVVDLNKIMAQVIDDFDLMILEKEVKLTAARLPVVYANSVQMLQLFSNLISNAIKFSGAGRKPVITIGCREVSGNEITESTNATAMYYEISVADNGIGFEEVHKQKIFNSFERLNNYTDFPGFGLGLSLCKKIVVNHDGIIKATSTMGEGSIFYVYLPKKLIAVANT
jgi:signal transduction histidine kinase